VGALLGVLGFLLAAGGLLTASNSRSLLAFVPQVLFRPEYRNFLLFLIISLLLLKEISIAKIYQ
jgi:hypothetical protein